MNPTDLARGRWRPFKKASEAVQEAERAQAGSRARLEGLQARIGPAEQRDQQALADAIMAGKAEPEPEADKLRAELAQEQRRLDALNAAVASAQRRIPQVVAAHRGEWEADVRRTLEREKKRYAKAVDELESAREAASDQATLLNWILTGDISEAAGNALAGRTGNEPDGRPALIFTRVLDELRRDVDYLAGNPAAGRGGPQPEPQFHRAHGGGARGMRISGWGA
jgi:hypothetical protein